jgi:hypothetical protein
MGRILNIFSDICVGLQPKPCLTQSRTFNYRQSRDVPSLNCAWLLVTFFVTAACVSGINRVRGVTDYELEWKPRRAEAIMANMLKRVAGNVGRLSTRLTKVVLVNRDNSALTDL